MSKLLRQYIVLMLMAVCLSVCAFSQQDGVSVWGAADVHADVVDLITLRPSINIAVTPELTLTSQQGCYITGTGTQATISCQPTYWFQAAIPGLIGFLKPTTTTMVTCPDQSQWQMPSGYVFYSSDSLTPHPLNPALYTVGTGHGNCLLTSISNAIAQDNSGITITINSDGLSGSVIAANGSHATISSLDTFSDIDTFNNSLSINTWPTGASGATLTSQLGDTRGIHTPQAGDTTGFTASWKGTTGATQQISATVGAGIASEIAITPCTSKGTTIPTVYPITQVNFPDGKNITFGMEQGNFANTVSGRINSFTLRTGGTISYTYATPCISAQNTNNTLTRTTSDGPTSYTSTLSGTLRTTTVLDPGQNKTIYYFQNDRYLVGKDVYQNTGSVGTPSYTLLSSDRICYQGVGTQSTCKTTSVSTTSVLITQRDIYHTVGTSSLLMSHTTQLFDSYGNVTSSTAVESITGQTLVTTTTFSGCGQGSTVNNHPCDIKTVNGANTIAEKKFNYNTAGAITKAQVWTGSSWLVTNYTPNPNGNGTTTAIQSPSGLTTTIGYDGSCNGLVPTSSSATVNGVVLSTSQTGNCDGGVIISTTDANGHTPPNNTYDSMFRPLSVTDAVGFTVNTSYLTANSTTTSWSITGASSSTTNTVDGYGRLIDSQMTDGTNYDTMSYVYQWDTTFFEVDSSAQPCSTTTLGAGCLPSNYYSYSHIDPLGRSMVDGTHARQAVSNTYSQNSVQTTLSPAPSGEVNKTLTTVVDGFGRASSSTAGSSSQIVTSYSYGFGSGQTVVTAARGSQQHVTYTDAAGRIEQVQTPEAGTTTLYYDSQPNPCGWGSYTEMGHLIYIQDANLIQTCFQHDLLGRIVAATSSSPLVCKRFYYDGTSGFYGQGAPTGYTGSNLKERLVEAETDDCTWPTSPAHMLTDEWFSYDADGRTTDVWESTPNSGGYYHTTVGYYLNGAFNSLSGIPGYPTYTVILDSNGRPDSSTFGTATIISNVTRDTAGRPTEADIASAGDKDTYQFDPYTGLMTNYTFTVNGKSMSGTPGWDQDGALGTLAITDTFNASGAQTCNFGYDDVARMTTDNCGSVWNMPVTYDQYDNISKSDWAYTYNPANNRMQGGPTYDAAGHVTYDTINTYTWGAFGKMTAVRSGNNAPDCVAPGIAGTCITYDAFDRVAETNASGVIRQILYGPFGRIGQMNGQTVVSAYLLQPGGPVLYASGVTGSTKNIQHKDWLGTVRLSTSLGSRAQVFDTAYAPYGEAYDSFGTVKPDFTGDLSDITAGLFDTPNRELMQSSGRWLSPDPAHASWNAYSYPTNPNSSSDPSGAVSPMGLYGISFGGFGESAGIDLAGEGCFGMFGCGYMVSDPISRLQAENLAWMAQEIGSAYQELSGAVNSFLSSTPDQSWLVARAQEPDVIPEPEKDTEGKNDTAWGAPLEPLTPLEPGQSVWPGEPWQYSILEPGPLGDGEEAQAFAGGRYTRATVPHGGFGFYAMYRRFSDPKKENGHWYSLVLEAPGLQTQIDMNIRPEWGNAADKDVCVYLAPGTTYYIGPAAAQTGYAPAGYTSPNTRISYGSG